MKMVVQEPNQTTQRVKVGMIGLAAVLLLIGLAAAIFSTASREQPVVGGARADVVANLAIDNTLAPADAKSGEPLAELGVAPSTTLGENDIADAETAKRAAARPR